MAFWARVLLLPVAARWGWSRGPPGIEPGGAGPCSRPRRWGPIGGKRRQGRRRGCCSLPFGGYAARWAARCVGARWPPSRAERAEARVGAARRHLSWRWARRLVLADFDVPIAGGRLPRAPVRARWAVRCVSARCPHRARSARKRASERGAAPELALGALACPRAVPIAGGWPICAPVRARASRVRACGGRRRVRERGARGREGSPISGGGTTPYSIPDCSSRDVPPRR